MSKEEYAEQQAAAKKKAQYDSEVGLIGCWAPSLRQENRTGQRAPSRHEQRGESVGEVKGGRPLISPPRFPLANLLQAQLEWGGGLAQREAASARAAEMAAEAAKPFARSADDVELDQLHRRKSRWGDPMVSDGGAGGLAVLLLCWAALGESRWASLAGLLGAGWLGVYVCRWLESGCQQGPGGCCACKSLRLRLRMGTDGVDPWLHASDRVPPVHPSLLRRLAWSSLASWRQRRPPPWCKSTPSASRNRASSSRWWVGAGHMHAFMHAFTHSFCSAAAARMLVGSGGPPA